MDRLIEHVSLYRRDGIYVIGCRLLGEDALCKYKTMFKVDCRKCERNKKEVE